MRGWRRGAGSCGCHVRHGSPAVGARAPLIGCMPPMEHPATTSSTHSQSSHPTCPPTHPPTAHPPAHLPNHPSTHRPPACCRCTGAPRSRGSGHGWTTWLAPSTRAPPSGSCRPPSCPPPTPSTSGTASETSPPRPCGARARRWVGGGRVGGRAGGRGARVWVACGSCTGGGPAGSQPVGSEATSPTLPVQRVGQVVGGKVIAISQAGCTDAAAVLTISVCPACRAAGDCGAGASLPALWRLDQPVPFRLEVGHVQHSLAKMAGLRWQIPGLPVHAVSICCVPRCSFRRSWSAGCSKWRRT